MLLSRHVLIMAAAAGMSLLPAAAAEDGRRVSFKEVAPPLPTRSPALNQTQTARAGDVLYRERAGGLPGARLTEKLTLKNTPGGRQTIDTDDDLQLHLVNGEPWFCAYTEKPLYSARHGLGQRMPTRREAGFYTCLRDSDGNEQTFEKVSIIKHIIEVVDREYSPDAHLEKMRWTYEETASGAVSPKPFVKTTLDPDNGEWFEAVVRLTAVENGEAVFRSELLNQRGSREFRPERKSAALTEVLPATVLVPHPFEGDLIYHKNAPEKEKEEEEKRRERAAQIEILAVEGDAVTYRVTRSFMPWRYWSEGPARRPDQRLRWRPRP